MLKLSELFGLFFANNFEIRCREYLENIHPTLAYSMYIYHLKAFRFEFFYPEELIAVITRLKPKKELKLPFKKLKPFEKIYVAKGYIKKGEKYVEDCHITEIGYELNLTQSRENAFKCSVIANYLIASTLKKLGEENLNLTRTAKEIKRELVYRDITFPDYPTELERVKKDIEVLREKDIFRLMYFRPTWIIAVSDKIAEFYLKTEDFYKKKLIEEYYHLQPDEKLTETEKKLKELLTKSNPNAEEVKSLTRMEGEKVEITLTEELKKCLPYVGRLPSNIVLPKWVFNEYMTHLDPHKPMCKILHDLNYLSETTPKDSFEIRKIAFFNLPVTQTKRVFLS
jgi:hypothetical protein